jgi:hypothetical protein
MANSAKSIVARLEEIKAQAAALAASQEDNSAANLAEEAAGLGLELAELGKGK